MSVLGPSFHKQIMRSPFLMKYIKPLADAYVNVAGYRKYGLKLDDLIIEENKPVQKALLRLSEKESYDRAFRIRRAHQCAIAHAPLPKDQWTKPEDDVPYLRPLIEEIEAESREREFYETVLPQKKQQQH